MTCTDNFSEGWAPANYLEPIDKDREEEEDGMNEVLTSGMYGCGWVGACIILHTTHLALLGLRTGLAQMGHKVSLTSV